MDDVNIYQKDLSDQFDLDDFLDSVRTAAACGGGAITITLTVPSARHLVREIENRSPVRIIEVEAPLTINQPVGFLWAAVMSMSFMGAAGDAVLALLRWIGWAP